MNAQGRGDEQETESDDFSDSEDEETWIKSFLSRYGNEYFCEVDESYIQDEFNLTGLKKYFHNFEAALSCVLDIEFSSDDESHDESILKAESEFLYGLIHQRYIMTSRGLHDMKNKFVMGHFGRCPRLLCENQKVVPCGEFDEPQQGYVKLFCPKCQDLYYPKSKKHANIDGAFFGTTFPHIFFLNYPECANALTKFYKPTIYGFRVNARARIDGYKAHHPDDADIDARMVQRYVTQKMLEREEEEKQNRTVSTATETNSKVDSEETKQTGK